MRQMQVVSVHADCDGDSLVYLAEPQGPSCHTGARTCWFRAAYPHAIQATTDSGGAVGGGAAHWVGESGSEVGVPKSTLMALEATIADRQQAALEDTSGAYFLSCMVSLRAGGSSQPCQGPVHPHGSGAS